MSDDRDGQQDGSVTKCCGKRRPAAIHCRVFGMNVIGSMLPGTASRRSSRL